MLSEVGVIVLCLAVLKWLKPFSFRSRLPYPPGPPSKNFLLGNLSDLPLERQWLPFTEWARKYGGITYFRVLHKQSIVINSVEVAKELFDRRSHIYSDRAIIPMTDLMGFGFSTILMPYNDEWKAHRRYFQQAFKQEASRRYQPIQIEKVNDMLYQLLNTPDDFFNHIRHESGAIIMSTVYGHDVKPKHDHFVDIAEEGLGNISKATFHAVNLVPILRYLPEWMPGGGFQRLIRETKALCTKMINEPFDMVKERMENGTGRSCLATELIESCTSEQDLHYVKAVCATSYIGGAETSVSSVETFFFAMAKLPDIQKKAQEEIDRVVGFDRLPTFEDRPLMPYCEALLREVLRWRPVTPIGVPHFTMDEDVYEGYRIPKGAIAVANIWGMSRDPSKYDDAETFDPSRFFLPNGELNDDDVHYAFGFGRRVCPGRYLASATVWLSIATVLCCFNISKKKDSNGEEISIDTDYTGGVAIHPLPFQCSITPRSESAKALILAAAAQED
ncbi:cytochrome P450 [Crepidotus variabilis]|uniref:Cytochrome P450 n=1 Tax=Crepidotus variabilis TaxID=179855 RepID=A0A9P6EP04_9AGAR|nr:cytochrome P450 [Crepidotus variabilis]